MILLLPTYSVYLEINHLPTMQEELMSPLTASTFIKDNSPVCRRTHHKATQEKGFLLYPPPYPMYMVSVELPLSLDLEDLWLFTSSQQTPGKFWLSIPTPWIWDIPNSREMPMLPSQVLSSQRNRAVSRDNNARAAKLGFDWGFRQPSAVCQNIKNLKQKRYLCISASFSTLLQAKKNNNGEAGSLMPEVLATSTNISEDWHKEGLSNLMLQTTNCIFKLENCQPDLRLDSS